MVTPQTSTQATRRGLHISTPVGVDTAHFRIEDFTVAENTDFEVASRYKASTGETSDTPLFLSDESGSVIEGNRAYLNVPSFQATVYGPSTLLVNSSLPKLLATDNVKPVATKANLALALEALERSLWSEGIEANIYDAHITRLDLCRNVALSAKVREYEPVFRSLTFPRTERRRYEADGYRWENDSREVVHYDKGLEKTGEPSRTLRAEYRLTKSKSVKSHVGVDVVSELLKSLAQVKEEFHEVHRRLLPSDGSEAIEAERDSRGAEKGFRTAMEELGERRGAYTETLAAYAYSKMSGAEQQAFLNATGEVQNRQAKRRARKKLDGLRGAAALFDDEEVSEASMYQEIRSKILAEDDFPGQVQADSETSSGPGG